MTADLVTATFVKEREKLIALACSIVDNQAIAEELVQDSWIRWVQRGYAAEKAQPIFRQIVANLARDWYRRNRTEREVLAEKGILQDEPPDSERIVIARQDLERVVRALQALPDRTVRAFRMHRIDGLTYAAIAKKMDISPSTAYAMVENALVHVTLSLRP